MLENLSINPPNSDLLVTLFHLFDIDPKCFGGGGKTFWSGVIASPPLLLLTRGVVGKWRLLGRVGSVI